MRARTLIPLSLVVAALALVLSTSQCSLPFTGQDEVTESRPSLVIGRTYRVDDAWVERLGEDIPQRFALTLPKRRSETHVIGVAEMPPGGLIQVNFRAQDGGFLENLFIAPLIVPMADMPDRLAAAGAQLKEQAPMVLSNTYEDVTSGSLEEIKIGALDAIALSGTYQLDGEPYAWRFVAIPHPDTEESLYAVGHVRLLASGLSPDDAVDHARRLSGKALSSLRLLNLAGDN